MGNPNCCFMIINSLQFFSPANLYIVYIIVSKSNYTPKLLQNLNLRSSVTFTLSTFDDEIHMTLAVRCGRSSILRQNLDKFFKHNNKCGMGPHVWPLGTYHVKYAPITFKYQHFRLFFLKKEKNSQNARSGVQGHPLHLLRGRP